MKKLISLFLVLTICVSIFGVVNTHAADEVTFDYTVSDGRATIIWSSGAKGDLVIPHTLDGFPVVEIQRLFGINDHVTSITIPASINKINETSQWLAYCCPKLENINVAEDNEFFSSVDGVLFNKDKTKLIACPVKKSGVYTIPDSVEIIGDDAFLYCRQLTKIIIPESVKHISDGAFSDSIRMESIEVAEGNTNFTSVDGVLFSKDKTKLICFPNGKGGTYKIPDYVTEIGKRAFYMCHKLSKITISSSIEIYGEEAFRNCGSIEELALEEGITEIVMSAFEDCYNLRKVSLPGGLKTIGALAFCNCYSLTDIVIPDSVTEIGFNAFANCESLENVTIPESVEMIHPGAYSGCISLNNIDVALNNKNYTSVDGVIFSKAKKEIVTFPSGRSGSYHIPHGVTVIGDAAFGDCKNITNISIPDTVTKISQSAFSGCENLQDLTLPRSVNEIGALAFSLCYELKEITIPNGITKLDMMTFFACNKLKNITIPESVTKIEDDVFDNCDSLTISCTYDSYASEYAKMYGFPTSLIIGIVVNGESISCDQPPVIIDDRTLVPLRAIFEALGATVSWDSTTRTATGIKGGKTISVTIDKKEIVVDGKAKSIDVPAQIVSDRTMVPARAIAEAFGCAVEWNSTTRTVIIDK